MERKTMEYISNLTLPKITVTLASFVAGMYVGYKLKHITRKAKVIAPLIYTGPTKMVLVVREDLKMQRGKAASQCCHATLEAYKQLQQKDPNLLKAWECMGQPKVVVKAPNLEEITRLAEVADAIGLQACEVTDAGHTQVAPGSMTVMAFGPGPAGLVDKVTGHLKLL